MRWKGKNEIRGFLDSLRSLEMTRCFVVVGNDSLGSVEVTRGSVVVGNDSLGSVEVTPGFWSVWRDAILMGRRGVSSGE